VYSDYAQNYHEDDAALNARILDVLVDAPVVSLKGLDFELDELRAHVSLFSKVLDLVELSVGVDAYLGRVKLTIESIEVQALVKVRLDNVTAILDRVLTTIDRNPHIVHELVRGVSSAVEDVGEGIGELVGEGAGEALSDIGSGTGSAVRDVGEGAGGAVQDVGKGAGSAVEDVGGGAGSAVEDVGGAGRAVGDVGRGAGGAAQAVGEGAGQAAQEAGQAARDVGDSAGQAGGAAQQATGGVQENQSQTIEGTAVPGTQPLSETTDETGRTVRRMVDESGSIVEQTLSESGEVLEEAVVGQANTTGEAGEVWATPAAERKAEDLGVDLSQVEGTGAGGRITVKDVTTAARGG
jgi:hypothetical protein